MIPKKLWVAIPSLLAMGLSSAEAGDHLWGAGYYDTGASVCQTVICQTVSCQLGCGCQAAEPACQPAYETVERTVMVPTMVTETCTVNVTEYRYEPRERSYTVCRPVPETTYVPCQYTVLVPEVRTCTANVTVCKPVMETQRQNCTEMVPYQETRQAVRKVCRMVPVTVMKPVYEDQGHWEEVPTQKCEPACGTGCAETGHSDGLIQTVGWRHRRSGCSAAAGCSVGNACGAADSCVQTERRWVPNMVCKQVPVTVLQAKNEDVPYTYTVTLYRPETRVRDVQVCRMVFEQQTRQVQFTVCHPEQRTGMRPVTTCKMVTENRVALYSECVPYTVQKQVQVQVCKLMPKTIRCQVPVSNGGGLAGCGYL